MPATAKANRAKQEPIAHVKLAVEDFDAHGTGRAVFQNRRIEVEHGIPGERIEASVFGKRRRWAKIDKVVESSPYRVDAPCPHFHQGCGGCPWQMLSYQSQLERKLGQAVAAFSDAGLTISLQPPQSAADPWRYRSTAALSLGRAVGFRRRGSQSIVPVGDCLISHELIGRLAANLNDAVRAGTVPNFMGQLTVEARVVSSAMADGLHVCIVPSPGSPHASLEAVKPLTDALHALPFVTGIVFRHRQDQPVLLHGSSFGEVMVAGRPYALTAATFFQTNFKQLPYLLQCVREAAQPGLVDTIVDVYGGVGLLGLSLASSARTVVEIEIDAVGIEAARRTSELQGLENIEFLTGKAEVELSHLENVDTVIVDPPRSGLTPRVVDAIGTLRPNRIVYVSCLARSMAHDLSAFHELGYKVGPIRTFDFYPQTYHLELMGSLKRIN